MGELTLGEQAAPATPTTGVTVYTTVATPSILRVKDDGGNDWAIGAVQVGTWTPVLAGSTTPGAHTYTTQVGRYIKIGTMVFAYCRIVINVKDVAMAGNATITGLPFTARTSGGTTQVGSANWGGMATTMVWFGAQIAAATATILLVKAAVAATGVSSVVAADIANACAMNVAMTIEVD